MAVTWHQVRNQLRSLCPPFVMEMVDRVCASPIGYRLVKGAFWALAGAAISRALALASSIFVARMLGAEGYGQLGIVQSTVGMFGTLAGFGLGMTATKHVAEYRIKDPAKAGRIMALAESFAVATGGTVASVLALLAPWLAAHTLAAPQLASLLRLGALLLLLNALAGAQAGALAGFEAFRAIATCSCLAGLATFPLMVGGAHFAGLVGAVWALIGGAALNWILNSLALHREAARASVPYALRGCTGELGVLWRFSLPAALSGALVGPVNWACSAMLVNQPNGYAEMGVFSATNQWRTAVLLLPSALGAIVLPLLANLHGEDDRRSYRNVLVLSILLNGAVALAAAVFIAACSSLIVASYGSGFGEAGKVLVLLVFSGVLIALNNVIGQAIASTGRMWVGLLFNGLWAAASLVLTRDMLMRGQGAVGLALASLAAYALHTLWQSAYLWHSLGTTTVLGPDTGIACRR